MSIRTVTGRTGALVLTLMLAAAACGGGTTTVSESSPNDDGAATQDDSVGAEARPTQAPEPTADVPTPEPTPEPTPQPTVAPTPEPEPTVAIAPVYWGSELEPGSCMIRLEGNPPFEPPDIVSCDELHEEEIYAKAQLDDDLDEPYPGSDALADRVAEELCDQATIDFAGEPWEVLTLASILLYPSEEEWDAGDRTIMCSAGSNVEGTLKIGTAAGGTIDTDDVLLARAGLASDGVDFDDWVIVTEHGTVDTVGSLTDAQFDIPLRRPYAVGQGFVFNAKPAGETGHETTTWGYSWVDQTFTDLGSILPGQELASTMIADGNVIFAARSDPADDWDLYSTVNGQAEVLVGGEGNQQYPTLTPDLSQIVYQDRGDIWVVNIDGSDPRQLTSGPATDWESIVSPDGETVVFASDRSGNDDLWAVSIGGGEPVNLTNHPADESWPVFSADGRYIYFGTDRLEPEEDRLRLMVMNADGTNQSWFGGLGASQALVVADVAADLVVATTPTLSERYDFELIEGEPGTTVSWTDSSGRLTADIPVGWRVTEFEEGIGFLASPRPRHYFDVWEVDGVAVTLHDGETAEEFFTRYDESPAVNTCDQFDGTGQVTELETDLLGISGNFNCGSDGAVGGVIAFYNTATGVGVLIEGQRDNVLDEESDTQRLLDLALSLTWQ